MLAEALELWRGRALADVPPSALVTAEADRLEESRLSVLELRIEADLGCGRHAQLVPELRRLLSDHPLREGLWALLIRALDGAGRHAEALAAYGQVREVISEELGVDPGPELQGLYQAMLTADAGPRPRAAAAAPATAPSPAPPAGSPAEATHRRAGPGSSSRRAPAQLPADVADFTGRAAPLERLCGLVSGARERANGAVTVAVVAGTPGLGKTTLAVHAAHRLRPDFPDGQLYVSLRGGSDHPVPADEVLARFLRDLGVDGARVPVDPEERAAMYRTRLAERQMLIVLDDARDAAQVRPLLPGTGSSAVIVSSRHRLSDLAGSRLIDLDVLDEGEAAELFTRIIGTDRAEAEPGPVRDVLGVCAGLPLAIRIAGARLAARRAWTVRTLADRLADQRRRMDELTAGDLAMRACFQVSFDALPHRNGTSTDPAPRVPAARRLAGAVHRAARGRRADRPAGVAGGRRTGGAGRRAPAGVPGPGPVPAARPAARLRGRPGPGRRAAAGRRGRGAAGARLVPAHRGRGRGRGRAVPGAGAARTRSSRAASRPPSPPPRRRSTGVSRSAPTWSPRPARPRPTACTTSPGSFRWPRVCLDRLGYRAEWLATHRIALASARELGDRRGEAWVLNNLGMVLGQQHIGDAIGYFEQALAIYREIGDRRDEARAANNLAFTYLILGRYEEAVTALLDALELQREGRPPVRRGRRAVQSRRGVRGTRALRRGDRPLAGGAGHRPRGRFGAGRRLRPAQPRPRPSGSRARLAEAADLFEQALAIHRPRATGTARRRILQRIGTAHARAGRSRRPARPGPGRRSLFEALGEDAPSRAELGIQLAELGSRGRNCGRSYASD